MKTLIIDDETLIHQALAQVCLLRGGIPQTAPTGEEGLRLWKSFQPDLIFLDLILPDQNGFSVIKKAPKTGYVIMMSAYSQYEERSYKEGASLFISKPFKNIFHIYDQAVDYFNSQQNTHPPL